MSLTKQESNRDLGIQPHSFIQQIFISWLLCSRHQANIKDTAMIMTGGWLLQNLLSGESHTENTNKIYSDTYIDKNKTGNVTWGWTEVRSEVKRHLQSTAT